MGRAVLASTPKYSGTPPDDALGSCFAHTVERDLENVEPLSWMRMIADTALKEHCAAPQHKRDSLCGLLLKQTCAAERQATHPPRGAGQFFPASVGAFV